MKFELFGRLKKAPAEPKPLPVDRIKKMSDQGLPEAEIIQTLKDEGYSFKDIDDALSQAVKTEVTTTSKPPAEEGYPEEEKEELLPFPGEEEEKEEEEPPLKIEEVEEIIEALVEEKLADVSGLVTEVNEKIKGIDERINGLNTRLEEMNRQLKNNQNDLGVRTEKIETQIKEIEPKVLSLEKAFKDVVPNLVDSFREVRELFRSKKSKVKEQ